MNYHLDWWANEEEKRKDRHQVNDFQLINQRLQRLLEGLEDQVDKTKYEQVANQLEMRNLSHCSLWHLAYLNNFESGEAALAQGLFLYHILANETFENQAYLSDELERIMRHLGNVDWRLYIQYGDQKNHSLV